MNLEHLNYFIAYLFLPFLIIKGCNKYSFCSIITLEINQSSLCFFPTFFLNLYYLMNEINLADLNQWLKSLTILMVINLDDFVFLKNHFEYR